MTIYNIILSKFKKNDDQSNDVENQENGSQLRQIWNNTAGTVTKVVGSIPSPTGILNTEIFSRITSITGAASTKNHDQSSHIENQENGSRLGEIYSNTTGTVKKVICFIPRFVGMLNSENISRIISTTVTAGSYVAPSYSPILLFLGFIIPHAKDGYVWCKENEIMDKYNQEDQEQNKNE